MAIRKDRSRTSPVRLQLLGPVTAWRDNESILLGPPRQRAILCVLAFQPGVAVGKQELIDRVWGDTPPKTADQSVYTYISGLRRALEPELGLRGAGRLLVADSAGYALKISPSEIDVSCFERHLLIARQLRDDDNLQESLRELEAALDLWKGTPLLGVPGPFASGERLRLDEQRLNTIEQRAATLLQLGQHLDAVAALTSLVRKHRLREYARELFMIALSRAGRQSDALEAFRDIRRVLRRELGIEPSESLQRCHERILRGEPYPDAIAAPAKVKPAGKPQQLPRDIASFVGRSAELVRLRTLLAPWDGERPQPIVAIIGRAGAGKSATAIHVAHGLREHFPDALLYANLHGATAGVQPLAAPEILGRFLRALGVSTEHIPQNDDEAVALLRDRLTGRQVLVVLDNAANSDQIRHLSGLPEGTAVLVTSREILSSLDDCSQVRLDPLTHSEAITMLAKLIGPERVATDPVGATELVNTCDRLPLAIRIVGARLADRPNWTVSDMVTRLQDERRRLGELESGDLGVRASLNASYEGLYFSERHLDRTAARTLASLGFLNIPDINSEAVSIILNLADDLAERALERLANAHLLESAERGTYRLHDLVRLFATEHADEIPTDRQRDALRRMVSYYISTTQLATRLMDGHRVQLPVPKVAVPPRPLTAAEAFDWLETERPNLLAVARHTMTHDDETIARLGIGLAFAMSWYLLFAAHRADLNDASNLTLATAQRIGDPFLEASALWQIATSLERQGFHAESIPYLRAEFRLQKQFGNRFAQMRALGNLAISLHNGGVDDEALKYAQQQLALARDIRSDVGERHALYMIGSIHLTLANFDLALRAQNLALSKAAQASDVYQMSGIKLELGKAFLMIGQVSNARKYLEASLTHAHEVQARYDQPECLVLLAKCCRLMGDFIDGLNHAEEALTLSKAIGNLQWARQASEEKIACLINVGFKASIPQQSPHQ